MAFKTVLSATYTYDNPQCASWTGYTPPPSATVTATIGDQSVTSPPLSGWSQTTQSSVTPGWYCNTANNGQISNVTQTVTWVNATWAANYTCQLSGSAINATYSDPGPSPFSGLPTTVPANGPLPASCSAVAPTPAIALSPTSGAPGSALTVSGTGYTPRATASVTFDGAALASGSVGADGTFAFNATVPASATPGAHSIVVTSANASPQGASFTVTPPAAQPAISLSVASGTPGSAVTVSGTGYPTDAAVTVKFDNGVLATFNVGANGAFSMPTTVPSDAGAGEHTFTVSSPNLAMQSASFTVTAAQAAPSIALSTNTGTPGSHFTVTGSHYQSGETVTVEFHSTPVTLGTATVAADGTFALDAAVPADAAAGAHTVTATGTASGAQSADFTVSAAVAPTPAPTPTITLNGSDPSGSTSVQGTTTGSVTAVTGSTDTSSRGMNIQTAVDRHPSGTSPLIVWSLVTGVLGLAFAGLSGLLFRRMRRA